MAAILSRPQCVNKTKQCVSNGELNGKIFSFLSNGQSLEWLFCSDPIADLTTYVNHLHCGEAIKFEMIIRVFLCSFAAML